MGWGVLGVEWGRGAVPEGAMTLRKLPPEKATTRQHNPHCLHRAQPAMSSEMPSLPCL